MAEHNILGCRLEEPFQWRNNVAPHTMPSMYEKATTLQAGVNFRVLSLLQLPPAAMNAAQQSISMPVFLDVILNCPMLGHIVLSLPLGLQSLSSESPGL